MNSAQKISPNGHTSAAGAEIKKCGLICVLTGAILSLLFIATAAVITRVDVTNASLQPITTAVTSLGTAISGFFAAKIRKKQGLFTGCAVGLFVFIGVIVLYLLFAKDTLTVQTLYKMVAFVAAGGAGGYLGILAPNKNINKV